ncbi:MAG: toll/interleukin-1 receptor domain-containing protein [Muribaculaceae bacterium]|nr:toll/interleukin-1 receptor domain-containing protein [Muribaculaceae bacterium]
MEEREQELNNGQGVGLEQDYKFYAFISYNQQDTAWGKRVQRKLEHYRMPATLCRERGWQRTPIKPVFFAPTDIQPGGLNEELQERLRASRHLIVICSPNSAKSEWVGKEIEFFHHLGRTDRIHFFIVDGVPHSGNPDTECFNPIVHELGLPEILGANVNEKIYRWPWMNRERAYVQLVSKLLGVEFDVIWRRHQRRLIRRAIAWTLGTLAVIAALVWMWIAGQPFDARLNLNEATVHNEQLPPLHDAVVTLTLDNETKVDTIQAMDEAALFSNIPHRYLDKTAHVTFTAPDFLPVDTVVTLSRDVTINVKRDEKVYGAVRFGIWNPRVEAYVPGFGVEVGGHEATSDADGQVSLFIPLAEQQRSYQVKAQQPLADDTIHMPCGECDIIEVK